MAKRVYDLYLDESGSFEKPGEHTLIGGVLVPQEESELPDFRKWEQEIRSAVASSGVYGLNDLSAGDEWHDLYQKSRRKGGLNETESRRFNELDQTRHYVIDHCSENKGSRDRWKMQAWVLEEYLKKLAGIGGVPVVFDNPEGEYHIDSNTTFLSIFANGFVRLYETLMKKHPQDELVLSIHAASRLNITRKKEQEKYWVSPAAGDQAILDRSLYINRIKSCVFLNGGSDLLELKAFGESMNSFEILEDLEIKGKTVPNPSTVVCDYICNCAWADTPARKYTARMEEYGLLRYHVFKQVPDLSDSRIKLLAQNHDWLSFLKSLISREFPEKETDTFFEMMGQDWKYNQQGCVDGLVQYLYAFIDAREEMQEWLRRLDLIMKHSGRFQPAAALSLRANLLLFRHTLLTHLGKDVSETRQAFSQCIREIRPVEQRDLLLQIFCNRQIVTETDCFRFDQAQEWFEAIRQFSEKQLRNSAELTAWFSLLSEEKETKAVSEQYGKALGSYVQLLTKVYRTASPGRKEEISVQAAEAIRLAFDQLSEKNVRARQNACDFLVETGEYDEAMKHLALSASVEENGTDFECLASAVLDKSGYYGERSIFLYLHYVSMMHRCFRAGHAYGETMLRLILRDPVNREKVRHLTGSSHPEGVVLWHLAASLAHSPAHRAVAGGFFENAVNVLADHGELFDTISMAVRAEMIALGLERRLPGKEADWQKEADRYLEKVFPKYVKKAVHNPFAQLPEKVPESDRLSVLYRIADTVVY